MKNVKNIVKGLLIGCIVVIGSFVTGITANAQDVNASVIHSTDKTITAEYQNKQYTFSRAEDDNDIYNKGDKILIDLESVSANDYNVEIQSMNKLYNSITIQKYNDLYTFYVDDTKELYLGEMINIVMTDKDEIIDYSVIDPVNEYDNVKIIYADNEVCCIRIGQDVYSFDNEDNSYKVGNLVNVVIQDDNILQVVPIK